MENVFPLSQIPDTLPPSPCSVAQAETSIFPYLVFPHYLKKLSTVNQIEGMSWFQKLKKGSDLAVMTNRLFTPT